MEKMSEQEIDELQRLCERAKAEGLGEPPAPGLGNPVFLAVFLSRIVSDMPRLLADLAAAKQAIATKNAMLRTVLSQHEALERKPDPNTGGPLGTVWTYGAQPWWHSRREELKAALEADGI